MSAAESQQQQPCRRCSGDGIEKRGIGAGKLDCGGCAGSGLAHVPKMRVQCDCGVRQPRATSAFTANQWMRKHLRTHRPVVR